MAEVNLKLSAKMPFWRMRACLVAAYLLNPFVRSEAAGERIGAAMLAWVQRGVKYYSNGKRIR